MIKIQTDTDCFTPTLESFKKSYPRTALDFDLSQSKNLFSNFTLIFSKKTLKRVQSFVKDFYIAKDLSGFQDQVLSPDLKEMLEKKPKPSVLCCFDFHYNSETDELKLIEVNTNASGYLIGMTAFQGHDLAVDEYKSSLVESFKNSDLLSAKTLYIMDQNPKAQKMYLEFLMYKEFFESLGHKVEIIDSFEIDQLLQTKDTDAAIYNRDTDFYFSTLPSLKYAFTNQLTPISPHPLDYDLLAKKTNLDVLKNLESKADAPLDVMQRLHPYLLESGLVKDRFESLEQMVAKKKGLFFKPATAFGGKSTYKGSSVSNKYLKEIWDKNLLYQQSFPAGQFTESDVKWKYDLRFYTYDGQVQFYLARVYQGQITNFKTVGGGFAPVVFE